MKLEKLVNGSSCSSDKCPSIFRTDRGTVLIRGKTVGPEAGEVAQCSDEEAIVEIPEETLLLAAQELAKA